MNMIEKVARGIARADGSRITGPSRHKASDEFKWDLGHHYMEEYVEKHWREHSTAASLAIEAMTEPSEEMLDEGQGWHSSSDRIDAAKVYQAMIRAALEEK